MVSICMRVSVCVCLEYFYFLCKLIGQMQMDVRERSTERFANILMHTQVIMARTLVHSVVQTPVGSSKWKNCYAG